MNRIKPLAIIAPLPMWLYQFGHYDEISRDDLSDSDLDFLALASAALIIIKLPQAQL